MRIAATSVGGARFVLAVGFWLVASLAESNAQFFNISPLPRPPQEVPGQTPGPAQNIAPPNNNRPAPVPKGPALQSLPPADRKSTRLNSSHLGISYAVFCLKKKNKEKVH